MNPARRVSSSGRVTLHVLPTSFSCVVTPPDDWVGLMLIINLFLACSSGVFLWLLSLSWHESLPVKLVMLGISAVVLAMATSITARCLNKTYLTLDSTSGTFARKPFGFTRSIDVRLIGVQLEEHWSEGPAGFVLTIRNPGKRFVLLTADAEATEQQWLLDSLQSWLNDRNSA